jgi:hypothetical protein
MDSPALTPTPTSATIANDQNAESRRPAGRAHRNERKPPRPNYALKRNGGHMPHQHETEPEPTDEPTPEPTPEGDEPDE